MLAVLPKGNANVRVDQGQHYEAAALMRDVAEEKAEKIMVRELRAAGLTEEGLSERSRSEPLKWRTARATRTENHGIPQMVAGRLTLGPLRISATRSARPDDPSPDTFFASEEFWEGEEMWHGQKHSYRERTH
jgi:hypothetical protein